MLANRYDGRNLQRSAERMSAEGKENAPPRRIRVAVSSTTKPDMSEARHVTTKERAGNNFPISH